MSLKNGTLDPGTYINTGMRSKLDRFDMGCDPVYYERSANTACLRCKRRAVSLCRESIQLVKVFIIILTLSLTSAVK